MCIEHCVNSKFLFLILSFLFCVDLFFLPDSAGPDGLKHLHGDDGREGADEGDGRVHEIVRPVAAGEGDAAELGEQGAAVDGGCWGAPARFPDLAHVGHHVVGTGTHHTHPLPGQ